MKQPRHSITNFLVSQSSQQQPSSQKIRHQKPLPSANRKPTITQFLTPQMSNQQPAIKRTYLQALIDKATEEQQQQPQEQNQRKRTSQSNPQSQSYTLIPQLDLTNHMTFSTTIASTWRKADELLFQTEQVGNVKIATWNSNHPKEWEDGDWGTSRDHIHHPAPQHHPHINHGLDEKCLEQTQQDW
jgi:hypothetical protein